MISVTHYCTLTAGGAFKAADRLHCSLDGHGVSSELLYADSGHQVKNLPHYRKVHFTRQKSLGRRLNSLGNLAEKLYPPGNLARQELFSTSTRPWPTPSSGFAPIGDVLHLHWIGGGLDLPSFLGSLPADQPLVWTLHDMNPLTGGCHYDWGCGRYRTGCGHCPVLPQSGPRDASYQGFAAKRPALERLTNLHIAADSHWLTGEARQSPLFARAASIQTVHYGLDLSVFWPRDRQSARELLGWPPDRKLIAFGADVFTDKRKGMQLLQPALDALGGEFADLGLVVFGRQDQSARLELPACPTWRVGFLESETLLAVVLSAADIFVIPSLQEAFGQTALEALACGTPVVGLPVGGIPDMVRPGQTGWLADEPSAAGLTRALRAALRTPGAERAEIGRQGVAMVRKEFDAQRQVDDYLQIYHRALHR